MGKNTALRANGSTCNFEFVKCDLHVNVSKVNGASVVPSLRDG